MKCIEVKYPNNQSKVFRVSNEEAEKRVSSSGGTIIYVPKKVWKVQERNGK